MKYNVEKAMIMITFFIIAIFMYEKHIYVGLILVFGAVILADYELYFFIVTENVHTYRRVIFFNFSNITDCHSFL